MAQRLVSNYSESLSLQNEERSRVLLFEFQSNWSKPYPLSFQICLEGREKHMLSNWKLSLKENLLVDWSTTIVSSSPLVGDIGTGRDLRRKKVDYIYIKIDAQVVN